MNFGFEDFVAGLRERLTAPLPGPIAHEPLRATPVGAITPDFRHLVPARPGSVLILLYPSEGSVKIPLTRRADYKGAHSGQISFPGGKRESGEDKITTALRESNEEIGLNPEAVQVLGCLTDFFVIPSNFIVTPVVAVGRSKPAIKADHIEATQILECDLFELVSGNAIKNKEILAAGKYRMLAPHFEVDGEIVWGATAMMLNEFRLIVQDVLKK